MTKRLAIVWLLVCVAAVGYLLHIRNALPDRIDTDLLALLPATTRDAAVDAARKAMASAGERRLVILVGHQDPSRAILAARIVDDDMAGHRLQREAATDALGDIVGFYGRYNGELLSPSDREMLHAPDAGNYFVDRALAAAYAPLTGAILPWRADPFGLFSNWLMDQMHATKIHTFQDHLVVERDGKTYVVLLYTLDESPFSLSVQSEVTSRLVKASHAAQVRVPGVQILRTGVILYAAEAAASAQRDVALIGAGSAIGSILLVIIAFGGVRPLALILLSLAVGTVTAVAVTLATFSHIHALTLVFGSSLIGVAVDYGLLALGTSVGSSQPRPARYRQLRPAMTLALVTTLAGYSALAVTPFPGLVQMAVFSAGGIIGAWLTVTLWFPWIAPRSLNEPRIARAVAAMLHRWPRGDARSWPLLLALALVCGIGLSRLHTGDDVRTLFRASPTLLREQDSVGQLLDLPSPAQFFVVNSPGPEATLNAVEHLERSLNRFVAERRMTGYDTVARWVPSEDRQTSDWQLVTSTLLGAGGPLDQVAARTGLGPADIAAQRRQPERLRLPAWLASPVSAPFRYLWLGEVSHNDYATLVVLRGLRDTEISHQLAKLQLPGVRYVDVPAQLSSLFAAQRRLLSLLLAVGYVLAASLLWLRYRLDSWRVLAPPAIATALTLAIYGFSGVPVQTLTLISLLLLLGIGVDYGIFLVEKPHDGRMFVATSLSAATTLLSFGLLSFSGTPALSSFGMTTLLGIGFAWALAPFFRPRHAVVEGRRP